MTPAERQAPLLVVDDPLFDRHTSRGYHPERPERLGAARRALAAVRDAGVPVAELGPRDASDDELLRVHTPEHVELLGQVAGKAGMIDADTFVSPDSIAAARRAAGGAIGLVEALVEGREGATRGAALLRPPGHHATPDRAMGFCLLNNAALAAAAALARGLSRVAVVDWDVHHGNGTQDAFYGEGRVLYVSLHQSPLYPGTGDADEIGEEDGRGTTVNVPLSPGAGDAVYDAAMHEVVVPALERFSPELVIVSAGFDPHAADPLASMEVTDEGFGSMARALTGVADRTAAGRIALLLEGGYDLSAIEASLRASLSAMTTTAPRRRPTTPGVVTTRHVDEIARARRAAGL